LPADRWAIVTSAPRALAMRRLQATGLPLPQWVITSEDVDHGKPAPDCFLLAARRLGVPIGDCPVFEDAPAGVAAAEAAGASVVVVVTADAQALVDLARRQGLILGVGYHLRFHPGFRLIRQMIVDGHIGELRHILAQWTFYRPTDDEWRAKAALGKWWSLAATGSHCLDLCHWLTSATGRSRVDLKAIVTNDVFSGPNDESAAVIASYTGGCTAMITSSVLFDAPTIFNVYGEKGCIEAKGMLARRSTTPFLLNGEAREYPSEDPYQKQVVAFSQAIVHGGAFESDGVVGSHGVNDLLSIVR
jgi:predicted dehydrogenase